MAVQDEIGVTAVGALGILVALAGASLLSFGSAVQQRGVSEVDATERRRHAGGLGLYQILALLRDRPWLIGTAMVIGAIVCQLTALALAPIAVVQPVGVLALVITALITARTSGRRLGSPSIRAILICVVAVAAFVTLAALTTRVTPVRDSQVVVVLLIVAAGVLLLGIGYVVFRRRFTRFFYVIASGMLFGFVATLAKVILGRIETVVGAHESPFAVGGLAYVCLGGIVVAGSLGQYFQQTAFRSGSPEVVVAGLTVIDPIVGATIGMSALKEAADAPGWAFPLFVVLGLAAIYGVVQLSRRRPDTG